jgi:hypothetical protein
MNSLKVNNIKSQAVNNKSIEKCVACASNPCVVIATTNNTKQFKTTFVGVVILSVKKPPPPPHHPWYHYN